MIHASPATTSTDAAAKPPVEITSSEPVLIAVAKDKYARGVEGPADDWRLPAGNARAVTAAYEVVEVAEALKRAYRTDAHFVPYIVRDASGTPLGRQPRINKEGLAWVRSQGFRVDVSLLVCDVDNPGHQPWTPELTRIALEQYNTLDVLRHAGIYFTRSGWRVLQPITAPIPVEEVEPYILQWLHKLHHAGLAVDFRCKDWTRHYRAANVRRVEPN